MTCWCLSQNSVELLWILYLRSSIFPSSFLCIFLLHSLKEVLGRRQTEKVGVKKVSNLSFKSKRPTGWEDQYTSIVPPSPVGSKVSQRTTEVNDQEGTEHVFRHHSKVLNRHISLIWHTIYIIIYIDICRYFSLCISKQKPTWIDMCTFGNHLSRLTPLSTHSLLTIERSLS